MMGDTTKEILDAATEAVRQIEAAQTRLLEAMGKAKQIAETVGALKSPNIDRIRALSSGAPPSAPNIERIRKISESLRDPDLAYRILDELPEGIILVDHEGIIQLVNKQTESLFGYTRFELDNSPLSLLLPVANRDAHAALLKKYFENPVKRPMMGTVKHGLTLIGLHKDGTEFALDISLTPIKTPHDVFVVAVTRRK